MSGHFVFQYYFHAISSNTCIELIPRHCLHWDIGICSLWSFVLIYRKQIKYYAIRRERPFSNKNARDVFTARGEIVLSPREGCWIAIWLLHCPPSGGFAGFVNSFLLLAWAAGKPHNNCGTFRKHVTKHGKRPDGGQCTLLNIWIGLEVAATAVACNLPIRVFHWGQKKPDRN